MKLKNIDESFVKKLFFFMTPPYFLRKFVPTYKYDIVGKKNRQLPNIPPQMIIAMEKFPTRFTF